MSTLALFEFHVSKAARERYQFDQSLFSFNGNVIFATPTAAREFANRMNVVRGVERDPEKAVRAADLYAMGLIDEALHALMAVYRQNHDKDVIKDAITWFETKVGAEGLERTLLTFTETFPPVDVHQGKITAAEWLQRETKGFPHREVALEELVMLHLANTNPAYTPYAELFDESLLRNTAYGEITAELPSYFATRPAFGPRGKNLFDVLKAPANAAPRSLAGQLAFLKKEFATELADLIEHFLRALDVIKEEEVAIWTLFHPPGQHQQHFGAPLFMGGQSGREAIPHFSEKEPEYERFSPDVEWMPRTVLLAKSVYVWLDQLSRQYGRHIHQLDHIPDEELATMARRGFTALWLIGIWQRSTASKTIKQLTGNPDAAASAYSLYDYRIADDLGGQPAYENLRERAARFGVRLASDMVPNHMGIDSSWVIDHPDWFLSLPYSPYPAYTFNGPDLSSDGRVEIKLEDHYYDRTDAAVVFRRIDRWTGDTRYVYHGNDGTTFPWNDTAQLNYLNPEVREAVMQTIIHVARMFPVIRFDAAMTLTKQHYQRLWFPQPGTGGAIPSRAEHGLTKADFDRAMPAEFWREVVDRIAVEVPGTLLLAEAFWLLEGYFVRTLGMHRVYNSAFMNMMRDEENANYRSVLKNTLEFDPEVLKRYVNFMNNPDERTAVDQFGKGDKYFGVCTLLATMPGLPMFGHGQIEGLTERYGMEFRRAQKEENADPWLVGRHEREITPLLHRRYMFAEVHNFLMYDFYTEAGHVNEDVYAYSNRQGNERALIVFHNRYADTQGWIRMSCAYAEKQPDGSKVLRQRSLAEGLGIAHDSDLFIAYRHAFTGQEHLQRASEIVEKGIFLRLGAYQCTALMDWKELRDDAQHPWSALCDHLGGRGVPSLQDSLRELQLKPLHDRFAAVLSAEMMERVELAAAAGVSAIAASPVASSPSETRADVNASEQENVIPPKPSKKSAKKSAKTTATSTLDKKAPSKKSKKSVNARVGSPEEAEPESSAPLTPDSVDRDMLLPEFRSLAENFFAESAKFIQADAERTGTAGKAAPQFDVQRATDAFEKILQATLGVPSLESRFANAWSAAAKAVLPSASAKADQRAKWASVVAFALLNSLCAGLGTKGSDKAITEFFDEARLRHAFAHVLGRLGIEGEDRWRAAARLRFTFAHSAASHGVRTTTAAPATPILSWVNDPEVSWLIGVNEYQGERFFNRELFEQLLWWMAIRPLIEVAGEEPIDASRVAEIEQDLVTRCKAAELSGYRVDQLLEQIGVL